MAPDQYNNIDWGEEIKDEIKNLYNLIDELEKKIAEDLNSLVERVDNIESFLIRRTRGLYRRYINK